MSYTTSVKPTQDIAFPLAIEKNIRRADVTMSHFLEVHGTETVDQVAQQRMELFLSEL